MEEQFTNNVLALIQAIPKGKISTYGTIARRAGNKKGAREVAEILHEQSEKHNLPWQRVIGSDGRIAFNNKALAKKQKQLLEAEGILFVNEVADLKRYGHDPEQSKLGTFFS